MAKLLSFLRGVEQGEAAISAEMTTRILDEFARTEPARGPAVDELSALTRRELDVLREMSSGASNREIAQRLFISENTVKNHVGNILAKLNLQNRRETARFASKHWHEINPIDHS